VHFVINDWNPNGPEMCFQRPCLCLDNNFINRVFKVPVFLLSVVVVVGCSEAPFPVISLSVVNGPICIEFLLDKNFVVLSQLKFLES